MIARVARVALAALLAFAGIAVLPTGSVASAEPVTTQIAPLIVVMDVSGSMSATADNDPARTRLDVARDAVLQTVESRMDQSPFGLIAYPGQGTRTIDGCSVGAEEVKLGRLDRVAASAAVRRLAADGGTPTGPALRNAADILKKSGGRGTILLVSDGEANCGDDPCEVAAQIAKEGLSIRTHSVGFNINESGRDELKCVASQLGGQYADANEDLGPVLEDLSGPKLSLDVDVPSRMGDVAGVGTSGSAVTVTATNTGQARADDVRVSLDFRDADGSPGALPVDKPVHVVANLEPNASTKVKFIVRPTLGTRGDFRAFAYVSSRNAAPKKDSSKTTTVVDGTTTITGILGLAKRVAVLGDSYSSGEGIDDYVQGTDNDPKPGSGDTANLCHRSLKNYGTVLFGADRTTTIACSGAVTADFYANQKSGEASMPPQLQQLREMTTVQGRSFDAVLLSVGGNDIGFAGLLGACLVVPGPSCVGSQYAAKLTTESLFNDLVRVYRDTDRAVNGEDEETGRNPAGNRTVPVVVVPYPRIVPTDARINAEKPALIQYFSGYCEAGINPTDTKILNEVIDGLNAQIERAVTAMRDEGRPIYFAADVKEAFQPDHTLCDDKPFAVGEGMGRVSAKVLGAYDSVSEFAHPNADGHEAMASAIAAWSSMATPPTTSPTQERVYWSQSQTHAPTAAERFSDWLGKPFDNWVTRASGTVTEAHQGFYRGSPVIFRINSVPHVIGSATADDQGRVEQELWIPADTRPGLHHIEAIGVDADGETKIERRAIWVLPQYAPIAVLGFVLGAILVGGAWFAMRRARRREAAHNVA